MPSGPWFFRYLFWIAFSRSMLLMLASVHSQAMTSANSSSRFSPPEVWPPCPAAFCSAVESSPTSSMSHMKVPGVPRCLSVL